MSKKTQTLICIRCPIGCVLTATIESGNVTNVKNHGCNRGVDYAKKELLNPTRTVTTTVPIVGGIAPVLPVKTSTDIPKAAIDDCLKALTNIAVTAPIKMGDIIVANIQSTGADIIATRTMEKLI